MMKGMKLNVKETYSKISNTIINPLIEKKLLIAGRTQLNVERDGTFYAHIEGCVVHGQVVVAIQWIQDEYYEEEPDRDWSKKKLKQIRDRAKKALWR